MASCFGCADSSTLFAVLAVRVASLLDLVEEFVEGDVASPDLSDKISLASREEISSLDRKSVV